MAWSTPMTATANAVLTAAEWNTYVRDNLLETEAAKASAANRIFVTSGANSIVERAIGHAYVEAAQTTSSSSYTDLTTAGPAVTLTTGTSALALFAAQAGHSSANAITQCGVAVSGASTIAATDAGGDLYYDGLGASQQLRLMQFIYFTTLTVGSNTFTMKYKVPSGSASGTFGERRLLVIPLS